MNESQSQPPVRPGVEELVAEADLLYRYALPRVRNHHTAEDLVQDTLVTAVHKLDEFQGRAALGTWLTGILRNKILDHLRQLQRHPSVEGTDLSPGGEEDPTAELFTPGGSWQSDPNAGLEVLETDPSQLAERAEIRQAVRHCVDRLPGNLRKVFVLREVEDCRPEEICTATGLTRGSLAVLLHRSRQLLRACLQRTWLQHET